VEVIFPTKGVIVPAFIVPPFDIGEIRRKEGENRKVSPGMKIAYSILIRIHVDTNWREETVSDGSGG
jgi:hypothetical protein